MQYIELPDPIMFEWDKGNGEKNWMKHQVSIQECEEAVQSEDVFIQPDRLHTGIERRYILIGQTKQHRHLFIVFTLREGCIRIISARNMHKKEVKFYEKKACIA